MVYPRPIQSGSRPDLLFGNQQECEGITEFEYHTTIHDQVRVQVDYSKLDIVPAQTLKVLKVSTPDITIFLVVYLSMSIQTPTCPIYFADQARRTTPRSIRSQYFTNSIVLYVTHISSLSLLFQHLLRSTQIMIRNTSEVAVITIKFKYSHHFAGKPRSLFFYNV